MSFSSIKRRVRNSTQDVSMEPKYVEPKSEVVLMSVSEELLGILVCPKCQKKVEPSHNGLECKQCSLGYPINEDMPVLLIDAAYKITPEEIANR